MVALSPVKLRRRSVTPAAIQICVPVANAIIAAGFAAPRTRTPDRRHLSVPPQEKAILLFGNIAQYKGLEATCVRSQHVKALATSASTIDCLAAYSTAVSR